MESLPVAESQLDPAFSSPPKWTSLIFPFSLIMLLSSVARFSYNVGTNANLYKHGNFSEENKHTFQ